MPFGWWTETCRTRASSPLLLLMGEAMFVHCGLCSVDGEPRQVVDGVEMTSRDGCGGVSTTISGSKLYSNSERGVRTCSFSGKGFTYAAAIVVVGQLRA